MSSFTLQPHSLTKDPQYIPLSAHYAAVESLIGNISNSRSRSNGLTINLVLANRQHNIALSVNARCNHDFEASLNGSDVSVDGTSDGNEGGVYWGHSVFWEENVAWGEEVDGVSRFDGTVVLRASQGKALSGSWGLSALGTGQETINEAANL